MVRQLAFASRARAGLRSSQTSELIALSRENNARDGVSGILLYSGESFVSIVEGSDASISALWRRVLVDDRHRAIVSLFDVSSRAAWFEGWRAGYVPEPQLAPMIAEWKALAPSLSVDEIGRMRAFCDAAQTF